MADGAGAVAPKSKTKRSGEEHRQLLTHHMSKLRAKQAEINDLRAPLKDAQEEFTALVNEMKADLGKGYTRKYIVGLLEDASTRLRNLLEEEERRARDREALGLPVFGIQADLFATAASTTTPDEAKDEVFYEAEGFMRGRNGLLQEVPDGTPPRFHQAVMRGFQKGQELTQEDFVAGAKLREAQAEPDAGAEAKDLDAPEPGTAEAHAAQDASVRRAKKSLAAMGQGNGAERSGATEPELAAQKGRAAAARVPEGVH